MDKAIDIGLILSEATLNAIKHAFEEGFKELIVRIKMQSNQILLSVEDNGKGFVDLKEDNFGLRMIKNLVQKSNGSLQLANKNGAFIQVSLPL